MFAEPTASGPFEIGRTLGRTFRTCVRSPVLGAVSVLSALTVTTINWSIRQLTATALAHESPLGAGRIGILALLLILAAAQYGFSQAAVTWGAVETMNGGRPTFFEILRAGVRHAAPMFLIGMAVGLFCLLGWVLLLFPALMIYTALIAAGPATIFERGGFPAAISRSRDMTRGYRWRVFAVLLVALLINSVCFLLYFGVLLASGWRTATSSEFQASLIFILPSNVFFALMMVFNTCVGASVYVELRNIKFGRNKRELDEVFA